MNARFYQKADERKKLLEETSLYPAWKVFKYGVISGPYFPVYGLKFSPNTGKYGPETTPYLDTFHAVNCSATAILVWRSKQVKEWFFNFQ